MACIQQMPCFKFIITAVISLICVSFACVMLGVDQFKNVPLATFCTSLITMICGFWMDSPKMMEKKEKKEDAGGGGDIL